MSEETRLLEAGRAVLERDGYAGLRVDDVLTEAGLSTRAFYRHFDGKAALFLALFHDEMARAAARLETIVNRAGTPAERVVVWVRAVLALAYDPRLARRSRLFHGDQGRLARQFPLEVERCVRLQRAPLEAAIADGEQRGDFPHADALADARAIHHLCAGLLADRLSGSTSLSRDAAVALATGFALQALRADGRERRARR